MADLNGPLFDGTADRLAFQMCADIEEEGGDVGVGLVRGVLGQVLQHPTGRYESRITSEPDGGDIQITDGGIVYGPWLEGTGSRNRSTRFKGYATFRRVAQALQDRIVTVADPIVDRYVRRMG
jgi:hypothetical protein